MGKNLKGKELGQGLSQRADGRYQARYTDRFGKRKCIYTTSLKEAKKRLADALHENEKRMNLADRDMILDDWYRRWLQTYKRGIVRENTVRHYKYVYEHNISPYLGHKKVCEVKQLHVQSLLNELKDKGYQWESLNKAKLVLGDMFTKAMENQMVLWIPTRGVKIPVDKSDFERRVLTEKEQKIFFECSAGRWYDNLFRVAINTGLRPGELAALTWSDIDFKGKWVNVNHTLVYQKFDGDGGKRYHFQEPKTRLSKRQVPMNPVAEKYLRRQYHQKNAISLKYPNDTELGKCLFVTTRNNPINATDFSHGIDMILKDINLMRDPIDAIEHFSGHSFRHTFATRCIESGIRPKTLQGYLGHATINMTMNLYVHLTDETKQEQMELLNLKMG